MRQVIRHARFEPLTYSNMNSSSFHLQGFRQQGVRWIDREVQKKASREGQMWRWGRYGFSVVALQKECQVEEVREGWTRSKKDGKMLLVILPGGDSVKHDVY